MEELQAKGTYGDFKEKLDKEFKKSAESFVTIGYLLKIARDTEILHDSGYQNMAEFAKAEYNLTKDQVSRFIAINDKYSIDGYSDKLQEKYEGYGVAKLAEMLTLPEAVIDMIEPEMTRAEIQDIKREVKEEQEITDIEVMLEEKNTKLEDMNLIQKFMYQYFHENRLDFIGMAAVIQGELETIDQEIEETLQVLAPSGIATKKVRIAGIGKLFLSIKGKDNNLELVNVRTNETEHIAWTSFLDDIEQLYSSGASKEDWEAYYREPFAEQKPEVAPVQQNPQSMAAVQDEQIPGQMNVDDYPELKPDVDETVDNLPSETTETIEKTESDTGSSEKLENVDKIEEIVQPETEENVEKTEADVDLEEKENTSNELREIKIKAQEITIGLKMAIKVDDYEEALDMIEKIKQMVELLKNAEKTE